MSLPRLREHEEVFAVVRASIVWRSLVLGLLLFGLALPCLFFFSIKAFGIELMLFNVLTFTALLFVFVRAVYSFQKTILVITNERAIVRTVRWFGDTEEDSIPLKEIDVERFPNDLFLFPGSVKSLRELVHDLRGL